MQSLQRTNDQHRLTPISDIDLRALAETEDKKDLFLSIYLAANNRDDSLLVQSKLKAMKRALPADLREAFQKTMDMIEPQLAAPSISGEKGRVIFASVARGFLKVFRLSVSLQPLMVLDSSPFLLPLARLKDDYQDYALLLLDSQEARLFVIRSDILEEKKKLSIDLMNKHKKGGWSQMRYNRLRSGAIKSFLTAVVEDLQGRLNLGEIKGLVVAGPGEAKGQLVVMLPIVWKEKLLGVVDISMQTSGGDLVKLGSVVTREERSAELYLTERLKEAVLKGEGAAYGLAEVGKALEEGRVNHLLLSSGFALPSMICKKCHFTHEEGESCPTCGGQMQAMSLERLYEQAERTGAKVAIVEGDEFLEAMGGVGALLRYH
ncbi:MAG: Vms1/Ankzf1 family peptidyl-tRNA hydrolase [Methanothrix sp.]|nr:Vms1/Ankzf1 family peptidyl-tRNA hydrolase [Methanothrix sp.]